MYPYLRLKDAKLKLYVAAAVWKYWYPSEVHPCSSQRLIKHLRLCGGSKVKQFAGKTNKKLNVISNNKAFVVLSEVI